MNPTSSKTKPVSESPREERTFPVGEITEEMPVFAALTT